MATDKEKTLEDVIINNTLSTDRIEMAIENMSTQQKRLAVEIIKSMPSGSGLPSSIGPVKYDNHLMSIKEEVRALREPIFALIAVMIGIAVFFMFMFSWLISTVQHIKDGSYTPESEETSEVVEANGSEPNTSTEVEVEPEKPSQSSPQSSSDAPLPN